MPPTRMSGETTQEPADTAVLAEPLYSESPE